MLLDPQEHSHGISGPLQILDPRYKLIFAVGYVVTVVCTPPGAWSILGVEAFLLALLIGMAGLPPVQLLRRWLAFFFLVGFISLLVATRHPSVEVLGLGGVIFTILVKNSMSFLMMLLLAGTTPFSRLLRGMRGLGIPPALVSTLQFMYRYLFVLGEELERMLIARRARSFGTRGMPNFKLLTGAIAMLFLRTLERGERVHAAMVSRGWDGTRHDLELRK